MVVGLTVVLLGTGLISLYIGPTPIPFLKIVCPFWGEDSVEHTILFKIRFPRIILGFAIGGALGLSGAILQGVFRNPLVEPYTLGISGGAGLGITINIVLRLYEKVGILSLPVSGFLGAIFTVILVYILSIKGRKLKVQQLLLTGVMISFVSSALMMFLMAISKVEDLYGIIFWIMGSLHEPDPFLVKLMLVVSLLGLLISYFLWQELNAFFLGEEEAVYLGINVERARHLLFIIASFLAGVSVSLAGIIGFVGLVVPHFMRIILGTDYRKILVSSFLGGAIFLIISDTLARTLIAPLELPVGVITGFVGGVSFIYVLTRKSYKEVL